MSKLAGLRVVVGAAALFIVLCCFNGLRDYSLAFSSFVDPDLKIVPVKTKTFIINDSLLNDILQLDNLLSYSKTVEENVLQLQQGKRKLLEQVFEESESANLSLGVSDLRELI